MISLNEPRTWGGKIRLLYKKSGKYLFRRSGKVKENVDSNKEK